MPADKVFCAPGGVGVRQHARMWADQAANSPHPGRETTFPSACDRPVLPVSFGFGQVQHHAHDGARSRRIATRMARTIVPVTATSASWKVIARARRTSRTPILISFSWRLVSELRAPELQSHPAIEINPISPLRTRALRVTLETCPHRLQPHDLYNKYRDQDSEIRELLGKCGVKRHQGFGLVVHGLAIMFQRLKYHWNTLAPKISVELPAGPRTPKCLVARPFIRTGLTRQLRSVEFGRTAPWPKLQRF